MDVRKLLNKEDSNGLYQFDTNVPATHLLQDDFVQNIEDEKTKKEYAEFVIQMKRILEHVICTSKSFNK